MTGWSTSLPLAVACGLPRDRQGQLRFPSPSQQCKRRQHAGTPVHEILLVLSVLHALHSGLMRARDLIIDSAPILAWCKADADAAVGHAPTHHPRPLLRGYRVHTLLCRGSGRPLHFLVSPANVHDAPFARPILESAMHLYQIRPRVIRLDAGYWGLRLIAWIHACLESSPLSLEILSDKRTAPACLPLGPLRSWANGPALNASLGASSSSFGYNAHLSAAGQLSSHRSP